jgi:hypothetical protein
LGGDTVMARNERGYPVIPHELVSGVDCDRGLIVDKAIKGRSDAMRMTSWFPRPLPVRLWPSWSKWHSPRSRTLGAHIKLPCWPADGDSPAPLSHTRAPLMPWVFSGEMRAGQADFTLA